MVDDNLSPDEKMTIGARLAMLAPPCEFTEVLEDVRVVTGDSVTMQKKLAAAAAQHNKDQLIPVKLPNAEHSSLLSVHGDLGGGYFLCPRKHVSFHFDHLKGIVSDVKSLEPNDADGGSIAAENWRHCLEFELTNYTLEHFPAGTVAVYAPSSCNGGHRLIACLESHFCKHQSTGRWRSEWVIKLPENPGSASISVHGVLKVQTHLYEEGNVQLISSKEIDFSIDASEPKLFAKECVRLIKEADVTYQMAVGENFKTMSDTTFKALRRQLPLTRSKIDWNKIITYQVGGELARAS
ncbi:unnamed protein product [Dicrocoelium dendriticum]|nr:unnamed protein product [Dicrocoelium dendriticum]CAH8482581.1 unnamed protein product [Dicrocoelium dendriticum]